MIALDALDRPPESFDRNKALSALESSRVRFECEGSEQSARDLVLRTQLALPALGLPTDVHDAIDRMHAFAPAGDIVVLCARSICRVLAAVGKPRKNVDEPAR